MTDDLYTRLAKPSRLDPATSTDRNPNPTRRPRPGTIYTASIETIDNDYVGALLGEVAP